MLRYKSYIALFAVAMVMASCSQDVIHDSDICENEVYATLPELNYDNSVEGVTRSALVYDYSAQKMRFTWEEGDQLGVFPIIEDAGRRQQIRFDLMKGAGTAGGAFDSYDESIKAISQNSEYVAFRPYTTEDDYTKLNVFYNSQVASAWPMMKYCPSFKQNPYKDEEKYKDSEKAASAHLSKADYMVSLPVVAEGNGHCAFEFKRVGAVVRFYLKSPRAMVYDGLQLLVKGKKFVHTGMLNATTRTITPVTTGSYLDLTFLPALDMTNTNSDYYYNGKGYIVSYMMVAPIDLSDAENVILYLKGHVGNTPYYYKAKGPLAKPNLKANDFYQWTSADNSDDGAIIFDEISVQDWERDVTYSNGEEGTGTGSW
jgi:hypothetical protein